LSLYHKKIFIFFLVGDIDIPNLVTTMAASSQPVVTPDDFSSIPSVVSWFLAVCSVLFVATKIVTKLSMTRTFAIDDAAILIALTFSMGMVVTVSILGQNGLGKREKSLSESHLVAYEKVGSFCGRREVSHA
jgi:hypothetical protein